MATYSSCFLHNIRRAAFNNFGISHLDNAVRSKIISLGIRKQHIQRPYHCSRAGDNLFHKIHTINTNISGIKPFYKQDNAINQKNLIVPDMTRNQSISASISHINVSSIVNKTSLFHDYISDMSPTICALTETRLPSDETDLRYKEVPPKGYDIISCPCPTTKKGDGVAVIYKSNLSVKVAPLPPTSVKLWNNSILQWISKD